MRPRLEFEYIVLSPPGTPDPSLPIAGSRAGAVGVVNLEFASDPTAARAAVSRVARFGRGRYGVLVPGDEELLSTILAEESPSLEIIIFAHTSCGLLDHLVDSVHAQGRRAYFVATTLAEAKAAEEARIDAVIAKGHEAGGWVGEESSFVLVQRLLEQLRTPVWVQGGVGLQTVAACYSAGAAGAVLDNQLLLARESPLPLGVTSAFEALDGSETECLGAGIGERFRVFSRPGLSPVAELREVEASVTLGDRDPHDTQRRWRSAVGERVDWRDLQTCVLPMGQDACFAADLSRRYRTVGGILTALNEAVLKHCRIARARKPLAEGAPLAQSHGTRYPIVQGPMTRVSDRAEFAASVADAGALPFLALALMRAGEVTTLLEETQELLAGRPWGVGILGFVPPQLRAEQFDAIRARRPPFALIAGGRPDQARTLEAEGIATYLHVPSPGLLRLYLKDGTRRFVFEGRECGGHVGPRSSFVLWDTMVRVLLDEVPAGPDAAHFHVLFAGGIHDGLSAAMVSAIAAPLADRGFRVGVLLGTAYLFTREAVETGAITAGFQQSAISCAETVLLETGPGHATRCLPSPFVDEFETERRRLLAGELPPQEVRNRLEALNIGRLRIAAKGKDRSPPSGQDPAAPKLVSLEAEEQWKRGMYMIGQVAALRRGVSTLEELHDEVSGGSAGRLQALVLPKAQGEPALPPADIAIIGMACILPEAPDLRAFWWNILNKVDAVREVPATRWDWRHYYDADRAARDKVYSRWGGFIGDVPFDPLAFGMPPNSLRSIEPFQLLGLLVARAALLDAGYSERPFNRERTSVIFGAGGGGGDLAVGYTVRSSLPGLFGEAASELTSELKGILPEWTEDSFAGLLMNVVAGRIANRLDLGGPNYTVDAACASSLAAVLLAVRDLQAGVTEMAVVGGVDAIQNPFAYLCFSKTQAFSPTGRCRPFDAEADGIAISEGFAAIVMKRLADAERDGDRIYAVVRGVGAASDGRDRSLTATRPEGQMRAMRRAYAHAGISPATIGLVEAHGTGTVAGDQAEVRSLSTLFSQAGAARQQCAIGSVKSMIGHTKATAGLAGLIKAALALHHRVLPPTLGVTNPSPKANFSASPFYVNTETRPWIRTVQQHPRRAAVSAFGFGGTDFHAVLEEYGDDFMPQPRVALDPWPAELFLWRGQSRSELLAAVSGTIDKLARGGEPRIADLAYTLAEKAKDSSPDGTALAIVAASLADLRERLNSARDLLGSEAERVHAPNGVHFSERPMAAHGRIAFLFPGQGSQFANMARDIAVVFPEIGECFERADHVLAGRLGKPLSNYIFPRPVFAPEDEKQQQAELTETTIAQPALGATELAYLHLLRSFGVQPEMVAGHSYGEFVALTTAGSLTEEDLLRLSEARGRFIRESATEQSGAMAAVGAGPDELAPLLNEPDLVVANLNAPKQTVVSGSRPSVRNLVQLCNARGLRARLLPVSCAFHSPLVAGAQQRLAGVLQQMPIRRPRMPVFSNTTAGPYPEDPGAIAGLLSTHLIRPVEFVREIEAMYEAEGRIFVEVGPRDVLQGLVGAILAGRSHLCVSVDRPSRHGLVQLLDCLAALAVEGISIKTDRLFHGRLVELLNLAALDRSGHREFPSTTWLVNGGRARPLQEATAEPKPVRIAVLEPHSVGAHVAKGGVSAGATTATDGHGGQPRAEVSPTGAGGRTLMSLPVLETPASEDGRHARTDQPGSLPSVAAEQSGVLAPASPRPAPGETPASSLPPAGRRVNDPMRGHQQLMQRFLESHQAVMIAYLASGRGRDGYPGAGTSAPSRAALAEAHPPKGEPPAASHVTAAVEVIDAARGLPKGADLNVDGRRGPGSQGDDADPGRARLTRQQIEEQLLAVVSDRTGYPTEMLALDADLEADLGIDSIKRVEIAGTVLHCLPIPEGAARDLESVTSSRTLRQVIDALEALIASNTASQVVEQGTTGAAADGAAPATRAAEERIGRFLLQIGTAPAAKKAAGLASRGVVVVVDGEARLGEELAQRLGQEGQPVVRIVPGEWVAGGKPRVVAADLTDPHAVADLLERIRTEHGPAKALIHLAALGSPQGGESSPAQTDPDLVGLFLLTRALQGDLETSAAEGGAAVLAATRLGGSFGVEGIPTGFRPGQGSICGFLKTLAIEWPAVRVKAIDVGEEHDPAIVDKLLAELLADDGVVEVGYRHGQRCIPTLVPAPLGERPPVVEIDRNSVVLVTGGARGITAEAAFVFARDYKPTLLLVGRTTLVEEGRHTAGLTDPRALRQAILDHRRGAGSPLTSATVEEEYRRLVSLREIRRNLERLRQSGAHVEYFTCDVRDGMAFAGLIDRIYRTYARIDGVVHGAGIIEDKLIRDKELASFQRVISTKLASAHTLAETLRSESLRFLVFFSSVSGRFGNRGQADYAAASEGLNKLAQYLDQRWPARVVSINWGPWLSTGMVEPEVRRQLSDRGVELIPPEMGRQRFHEELRFGRKGEVEVTVGGGKGLDRTGSSPESSAPRQDVRQASVDGDGPLHPRLPLLSVNSRLTRMEGGRVEVVRSFAPDCDLYLDHHRMDGRPVVPFAFATELMVEVAAAGWPHLELAEIRQLKRLTGILVDGREALVRVLAEPTPNEATRRDLASSDVLLTVAVTAEEETERELYRAQVRLRAPTSGGDEAGSEPPPIPPSLADLNPYPMTVADTYRTVLWHGPLLQGIAAIEGMDSRGARALLKPSAPSTCLRCPSAGPWVIDPVLLDTAIQVQGVWARLQWDVTPLPAAVESCQWYGLLRGREDGRGANGDTLSEIRHELRIRPETRAPLCRADHYFYGPEGQLLGVLTDVVAVGTSALNRLAGVSGTQPEDGRVVAGGEAGDRQAARCRFA